MKFLTYWVPILAALANAGKVDECAGSCISKAIGSTGCASSDSQCICASESFLQMIEECGTCSEDGKDAAVALAENYCDGVSQSTNHLEIRQWDGLYAGHPIERWFANHPEYLKNHMGWLDQHADWALAHEDFLKEHLGHPWHPHPSPPSHPHHPHPTGKPTPTHHHPHGPHTYKPSPTVYP